MKLQCPICKAPPTLLEFTKHTVPENTTVLKSTVYCYRCGKVTGYVLSSIIPVTMRPLEEDE